MLFDKLDKAKLHGLDTSNVSCRVEMWRDEPSRIGALPDITTNLTHDPLLALTAGRQRRGIWNKLITSDNIALYIIGKLLNKDTHKIFRNTMSYRVRVLLLR